MRTTSYRELWYHSSSSTSNSSQKNSEIVVASLNYYNKRSSVSLTASPNSTGTPSLSSASIGNYFSNEMPLIASQLFKEGNDDQNVKGIQEEGRSNEGEIQKHTFSKEQHQDYYSFEDFHDQQDDDDEDMLAAQDQLTPALPQKSHLRASRILENLTLNLPDHKSEVQESLYSSPLDLYLSSEEDGSASGDDYEDVVSDEEKESKSVRRQSYEETATAISFQCLKPHLVDINHRNLSPASYALESLKRRPVSVFSSKSQPLLTTLPPRISSRPNSVRPPLSLNTTSSNSTTSQTRPSFLSNDPYPTESPNSTRPLTSPPARATTASPQTTKSEKSSTGWNGLRAVSRTLAIARKKVSAPAINVAYNAGVVPQRNSSISPLQNSKASTSSASLLSTETNAPSPISVRRRSQTFDRLIRPSSRGDKRGSQYSGRYEYGSEEWKALASPAYMFGNSRPDNDNSMVPRQQASNSPVDICGSPISPVDSIIPSSGRNRSYTTSQSSSQSRETKAEPQRSIPPSSATITVEDPKQSRRMTAIPDYSRAGKVARERAEQRRDSAGLMSPGSEVVGNTYHDIMKSVAAGGEVRKDGGKVVRGRSSMALLGLRRGGVRA